MTRKSGRKATGSVPIPRSVLEDLDRELDAGTFDRFGLDSRPTVLTRAYYSFRDAAKREATAEA